MAYDLEEQEQIASLKAFWNKFGNMITWIAIIVLGSYAAYNYWNYSQRTNAAEASGLYEEMQKSLAAKDNAKVQRIASDIESKYARSAYAQMSALSAAKSAFDANDGKTAKARLQWVVEHGSDEYKSVARLRLAGLQLDEKAYDDALKTLNADVLPQFAAAVADRKGDVLVAQNKVAEARTAYQAALDAMAKNDPARQLVQLKLEAIGGTVATPKAAA
ncbi:YfgM family protein [Massilia soli]|uniref:Tetratricopeptide repeat protein n=1 Tax=Massilia soli TaxID=2792854 RepID=A0ABS7SR00_9BURK|nr:tetratricopeptide repeat protein [Massilia soli]MBZ2208372.1 tetratricopeptide repeat protein [Massilia soli]